MSLPEVGGPALPIILSSCAFHRSKGIQLKWQEGALRVSSAHQEKMLPGASLKRMTWRASWLLPSEKRRQQAQSLAVAPGKGPRVTWPQVTEPSMVARRPSRWWTPPSCSIFAQFFMTDREFFCVDEDSSLTSKLGFLAQWGKRRPRDAAIILKPITFLKGFQNQTSSSRWFHFGTWVKL